MSKSLEMVAVRLFVVVSVEGVAKLLRGGRLALYGQSVHSILFEVTNDRQASEKFAGSLSFCRFTFAGNSSHYTAVQHQAALRFVFLPTVPFLVWNHGDEPP